MNSSGSMDGSQSDASYREDDFKSSDTESLNGDRSARNNGHLSAGGDRCCPSGGGGLSDSGSLDAARREFNKNRKIIIKNIPPVRYEEVKEFLGSYSVSNISISKRARHAVATLTDGGQAEGAVAELSNKPLMDTPVSVAVFPNECLLCIAHLPLNLDDADFRNMVSEYGSIERAFLMRNKEGRSKGYGFVEFSHNKELSTQARNMLDSKRVGSCILHCDFLDTSIVSFEHLQSKCLFIDHLPAGYENEMELRNIFSFVKTPTFFRLHTADNQTNPKASGSFAVVEYETAEAAEETQRQGSGLSLRLQRIRVTFCLPGRSGIDLFSTLMAAHSNSSKQALLPNPGILPAGPANDSLTNPLMMVLLGQSPRLLRSFQKILQQLQTNQPPNHKPGLLGMAPNMPPNPLMNPNLQVALLAVLLAMQLQQREPSLMTNNQLKAMLTANLRNEQAESGGTTRPSLLGNPMIAQANALLQNLSMQNRDLFPNQLNSPPANGNSCNIHFNQLYNWNQLINLVQGSSPGSSNNNNSDSPPAHSAGKSQGLLGDAPGGHPPMKKPLLGAGPGSTPKTGLLGDAPGPEGSRPILGGAAGGGPEVEKRSLLGNGPPAPPNLFPDSGSKENVNVGPANPLLALFLESQIRQQLETLRTGGNPGGGSNLPAPHQMPPPMPGGRPPMPPQGPLPPRPPLLGPQMSHRPMANRRPPRVNLQGPGPGPHGPLHGQMPFPPTGRPPLPPPPSPHNPDMGPPLGPPPPMPPPPPQMTNGPPPGKLYKPLLPNPNCANLGPPPPMRKPGLLGEHPGATQLGGGRSWQADENGGQRGGYMNNRDNPVNFQRPNNKPEKVGLLGDAPPQFAGGHGQNNHDLGDDSMSWKAASRSSGQPLGHQMMADDWGAGLWEKQAPAVSQPPPSSLPLRNNTSDNFSSQDKDHLHRKPEDSIEPNSYLQQYTSLYQQYLSQYSQAVANIYNQGTPSILPGETPSAQESLLGAPYHGNSPKTPVGSKRGRPHLLPSPEPSPEGNYVGQHSQGLGGHYASSYTKKRKVF